MSRMAFLTRVLAFSHVVPPSRSRAGRAPPRVLLDQVEARHGDEQLVVAGVAQFEELERLVRPDGHLLQADELADAVVDVDDEVADLQVAEVARGRPAAALARAVRAAPLFFEEVRLGVDLQAARPAAGTRARARRRDEHARGERVLAAIDVHAAQFVVFEHLDETFGAARRGCHEQHHVAAGAGRRTSAIQSAMRPEKDRAGWEGRQSDRRR